MSKRMSTMALFPLLAGLASPAGAALISDGGFEVPDLAGAAYGFCYLQSAYPINCVWSGVESTNGTFGPWAGINSTAASTTGTAWHLNGMVADGKQFAVLQDLASLGQHFQAATAGPYLLTWSDAGRADPTSEYGGNQTYIVRIDTTTVGTYDTFSGQAFTPHSLLLTLTPGDHWLWFTGRNQTTDQSAYIDAVAVAGVPEPTAYALMLAGLGAIGLLRRRRTR
jgi:hypothetical protein